MQVTFAVLFAVLATSSIASAQTLTVTDNDVLNFALQSECLAAAFWTAAATGENLTVAQLGRFTISKTCEKHCSLSYALQKSCE